MVFWQQTYNLRADSTGKYLNGDMNASKLVLTRSGADESKFNLRMLDANGTTIGNENLAIQADHGNGSFTLGGYEGSNPMGVFAKTPIVGLTIDTDSPEVGAVATNKFNPGGTGPALFYDNANAPVATPAAPAAAPAAADTQAQAAAPAEAAAAPAEEAPTGDNTALTGMMQQVLTLLQQVLTQLQGQ